jgi:hypothetical protein
VKNFQDWGLRDMTTSGIRPITWDIDIPLVTNGYMLRAMLKVTLGASVLVDALVSFLLAVQGEWRLIPIMGAFFALGGAGFFLVSLLIMLLVFGNRFHARFTVGDEGVCYETLDRVAKAGSRGVLLLGLMTARAGAAGSGLLAHTQQRQTLSWSGRFRVGFDPLRRTVVFGNSWRTLMVVYCLPDNYDSVRQRVCDCMRLHQTALRGVGRSPVVVSGLRTVLVVLACLPAFMLGDVFDYGLLLPLLLMCFAIAMVWLVRHLAWVVLVTSVSIVVSAVSNAMSMRQSPFFGAQHYRRFEVLSGDHWALTVLAIVGIFYLMWLARQILRQRIRPVLEADMLEGGME